jgi:hypothetical protein
VVSLKNLEMDDKNFTLPMYKATSEENHKQLLEILKKHVPTLRKYELITDTPAFMLQSDDGTIMEVFEWKDEKAKNIAHEHPAVRTIWGEMEGICTFPSLGDLPESKNMFPSFKVINSY